MPQKVKVLGPFCLINAFSPPPSPPSIRGANHAGMEVLDPDPAREGWKLLSSSDGCLCCVAFLGTQHASEEWASACARARSLAALSVAKLAEHIACFLYLLVSILERETAFRAQRKLRLRLHSLYW